jgi:hypothetical protein
MIKQLILHGNKNMKLINKKIKVAEKSYANVVKGEAFSTSLS